MGLLSFWDACAWESGTRAGSKAGWQGKSCIACMPADWGAVDVPVYHPHAVVSNFKLECVCRREQQMLGRVNVYVYVRREGPRRGEGKVRSRKSGARTRQLVQVPPAAHSSAPRCGLSCTSLVAFSCILVHVAPLLYVSLRAPLLCLACC